MSKDNQVTNEVKFDDKNINSNNIIIANGLIVLGTSVSILVVVNQIFNIDFFGTMLEGRYLNFIGGIFLALSFIIFRATGKKFGLVPWYDWLLALFALSTSMYLAYNAERNLLEGWEYGAPEKIAYISTCLMILILEATRRAGGWALFCIVAFFALYPTFASHIPDPLSGFQSSFLDTVSFHILSSESTFGTAMRTFGQIVIGFIIFGSILQFTGGAQFFNDLALGLVGGYRGGSAKVSIFASGFMGSMSGSVISNILSTGSVSIPAMRKNGFPAHTAAATEACASTGGVLMPPIMGAAAFVMASFLAIPYSEVVIAATIPSLLYYFGLFVQIDSSSARSGLKGLKKEDLPSKRTVLKKGWPYIFVFSLLVYLMIVWHQETRAPFYVSLLLLLINQFILKEHKLNLKKLGELIVNVGAGLAELTAILLGVGLVVGAFSATGLAGTLVNELIFLAGDNNLALLVMGALTAFVFGMGMTVTACYIFLAVVLAPALEHNGLNQIAIHMFILYWGMVSYLTPPVALGAFTAASLAGCNAMKTGFEAMRLGSVIYIIPFFFVLNPALVAQGTMFEISFAVFCALLGILMIGNALQGYVTFVGTLKGKGEMLVRVLLFIGGFMIALPDLLHINQFESLAIGIALSLPAAAMAFWRERIKPIKV